MGEGLSIGDIDPYDKKQDKWKEEQEEQKKAGNKAGKNQESSNDKQ